MKGSKYCVLDISKKMKDWYKRTAWLISFNLEVSIISYKMYGTYLLIMRLEESTKSFSSTKVKLQTNAF